MYSYKHIRHALCVLITFCVATTLWGGSHECCVGQQSRVNTAKDEILVTSTVLMQLFLHLPGELKSMPPFAGCVAVVNRPLSETSAWWRGGGERLVSFDEAAITEYRVFQDLILKDLPPAYEAQREAIEMRLTTPNLIKCMDVHFHNFIVQQWKPAALAELQPKLDQVEKDLKALDLPVDASLTIAEVLTEVMCQVLSLVSFRNLLVRSDWCSLGTHLKFYPNVEISWRSIVDRRSENP